jgi:hypothetical protein
MPNGSNRVKRRVWIGIVCAIGVTVAWWALNWNRPVVGTTAVAPKPFVRLASVGKNVADQVLREQAELFDPTPLFFPTAWNYGQQPARVLNRKQPGQFFDDFEAKRAIDEQKTPSYGAEPLVLPEKLADVLVQGNEAPFAGMGQIDRPQSNLPVRSGYLEIYDLKNRDNIKGEVLSGLSLPRTDFAPVEFLVMVEAHGLVGEPLLTATSGWEEVDNFFRAYLVKSYRLGERLRPGRYRVVIGA